MARQNNIARLAILTTFLVLAWASLAMAATETIRNGNFTNGLTDWNISPGIDPAWSPLQNGTVNLNPPGGFTEYSGPVIHQNLNVQNIGGKEFTFSVDLLNINAYDGHSLDIELFYVADASETKSIEINLPNNTEISSDPQNPTPINQSITFPANARKLTGIEVSKKDYGTFLADNFSLNTNDESVVVGEIPVVNDISAYEGPYGTNLTITGNHFGTAQGFVLMGEKVEGISIQSWSDTSIDLAVQDPARSGPVNVVSDFVASDFRKSFSITSPHYTLDAVEDEITVVKGQQAEFVIDIAFQNEFVPTSDISLSITSETLPSGAKAAFAPATLAGEGGSLLKVDTSSMAAGEYEMDIESSEASTQPRHQTLTLKVVSIQEIQFLNSDLNGTVDSLQLSRQGEFNSYESQFSVRAKDSEGDIWTLSGPLGIGEGSPLTVSADSSVVDLLISSYNVQYFALQEGEGYVQVDATDGTSAQLPVRVNVPDGVPYINPPTLTPSQASPAYTGNLTFHAESSQPFNSIGNYHVSQCTFNSTFLDKATYSQDNKIVTSEFQLKDQKPCIFSVLLYARSTNSNGTATANTRLDIVPDPNLAQLKGGVRMLDDIFAEYFLLEFYDQSGNKVHERELFMYHKRNFHLAGIPVGAYKLKFIYDENGIKREQWYPNAGTFQEAEPLEFRAGETVEDVYAFLKQGPTISISGTVLGCTGPNPLDATALENAFVYLLGNYNLRTATDANGTFTLDGVPKGDPFVLKIGHNDYITTTTGKITSQNNIIKNNPFTLFSSQAVNSWEVNGTPMWQSGKSMITGRVLDAQAPNTPVRGATVSYNSSLGSTGYGIAYFDGEKFTSSATGNGLFYIYGIETGDEISVRGQSEGWIFPQQLEFFNQSSGSLHQGMLFGTAAEPTLKQVIHALRIVAGESPGFAGLWDINNDGKIGLPEAIFYLQVIAEIR